MVRHILSDGREVGSIEGLIVPPEGKTAIVYRVVANLANNKKLLKEDGKDAEEKAHGA